MSSTSFLRALALGLCFQAAPVAVVSAVAADSTQVAEAKTLKAVQVFKLAGTFSEVEPGESLFGIQSNEHFAALLNELETVGSSPLVDTIILKLEGVQLGSAQTEELVAAIRGLTHQKKKVFAYADSADLRTLQILSAATQSALAPEGSLTLLGLNLEITHFSELFKILGLQADFVAVGEFKSALEPYTRTELSPQARENYETLADGLFNEQVQSLAQSRKLKPDLILSSIDKGLIHAEQAKRLKLIDKLSPWSTFLDEHSQADTRELAWPKTKPSMNLSSPMDFLSAFSGSSTANQSIESPKIAVFNAEGAIIDGRNSGNLFDEGVIASEDVLDQLHDLSKDPHIKALVVRINSPGGSALASDLIWQELKRIGKNTPIVVSLGDTAASGGYYIASAGRHIYADPSTITGSIGVFGGKVVLGGLLDKAGITTTRISRGENANLFSPTTPFSDKQRQLVAEQMQVTYRTFVNRVAQGRNMSFDAVEKLARGRVYTGRQALEVGLVDKLGGLQDAISEAKRLAKLEASAPVEYWPKGLSFFDALSKGSTSPRLEIDLFGRISGALPAGLRTLMGMLQMPSSLQHGLALSPWTLWPKRL